MTHSTDPSESSDVYANQDQDTEAPMTAPDSDRPDGQIADEGGDGEGKA